MAVPGKSTVVIGGIVSNTLLTLVVLPVPCCIGGRGKRVIRHPGTNAIHHAT